MHADALRFRGRRMPWTPLLLAALGGLLPGRLAAGTTPTPAARRAALIRAAARGPAAVPRLAAALNDENPVVRRTAANLLASLGQPGRASLRAAARNSDLVVRRTALFAACQPLTAASLPALETALADPHPALRLSAARLLVALKPRDEAVRRALQRARDDRDPAVRDVAARALWPFHKDVVSIRNRKDWDHDVVVTQTIPLPDAGWRFALDPRQNGHEQGWFAPDFDDSGWTPIVTGKAWEEQGHSYDGVAWYRGAFDLPARPEHRAVEICFDGVDECAWVWINGRYVGQHDLGPDGWDKPFTLDITEEVRWGERNQITVRVQDSAYAGGIWKPVRIEVLQ
jgi:hypothetical protein